jgi:hypothetical protein
MNVHVNAARSLTGIKVAVFVPPRQETVACHRHSKGESQQGKIKSPLDA